MIGGNVEMGRVTWLRSTSEHGSRSGWGRGIGRMFVNVEGGGFEGREWSRVNGVLSEITFPVTERIRGIYEKKKG